MEEPDVQGILASARRLVNIFFIIDQDDYPDFSMLEKMYHLTQNGATDCVSCGILEKGF